MRQRIDHLHQMIVGYVIGERNLADRTKALVVERQVDQDPERIIGIAREPHTPLPRGTLGAVCIQRIQIMAHARWTRSEEHTSELQSLMRISYAVFCLKKKNNKHIHISYTYIHYTTLSTKQS